MFNYGDSALTLLAPNSAQVCRAWERASSSVPTCRGICDCLSAGRWFRIP